ncbi:YagK/YfjJ domain-containing protein [Luteimonas changyuni]|uniref:YagK/YfjJ domain-containing protein n=1 Tax=Luteimonas sp. MJ145 TaxID=3129234 RepID=UPI0031BAAE2B
MDFTNTLRDTVDDVGELLRSTGKLFDYRWRTPFGKVFVPTKRGKRVQNVLKRDLAGVSRVLEGRDVHPYFSEAARLAQNLHWEGLEPADKSDLLEKFMIDLRAGCSTPSVKRRIDNAKTAERKNMRSAYRLLDQSRLYYSKLLVIRLDLEFATDPFLRPAPISYATAREARNRFFHVLRTSGYAAHLVGYIWKTEWGFSRGFHHHVVVVLYGQAVRNEFAIAEDLGNTWRMIAGRLGSFHSCNHWATESYDKVGVGMIHRSNDAKWETLADTVRYTTKAEVYARSLAGSSELFGTGGPYNCFKGAGPKRKLLPPWSGEHKAFSDLMDRLGMVPEGGSRLGGVFERLGKSLPPQPVR